MDSSDKEKDLENISKRSVANGVELNINSRTLGVYEKYLKNSIQSFFHEPQSTSKKVSIDAVSHPISDSPSDHIVPVIPQLSGKKQSTSKKRPVVVKTFNGVKSLTVLGASCTLLLFAMILVMLNTKGVLVFSPSISAASVASDNSYIDLNAHNNTATIDTSERNSVPVAVETSSSTLSDAVYRSRSTQSIPSVSYTDFKEEAQRTLYREDKDAYKANTSY